MTKEEYDWDSTPSTGSWMSFGSKRSSGSSLNDAYYFGHSNTSNKQHKSNQAAWQAIKAQQAADGRVGIHHFKLLGQLGSGDLGHVYLCQIRNPVVGLPRSFYAMKVVDREALAIKNKLERARKEKEILRLLDHPFLPTLYAEFDASHYSCIVMDYCPGGDLYAARHRQPNRCFCISSAKFYAAEVLLALEYLHMLGIVYRDLKPENVLVREDGHIMLSDFDLSFKCDVVPKLLRTRTIITPVMQVEDGNKSFVVVSCLSTPRRRKALKSPVTRIIREQADVEVEAEVVVEPTNARSKSFVGTHEYLAPEVISGEGHGNAVDWWTFGVFLYEMLYGTTPFKGENHHKTLTNILKQPLSFPRIIGLTSTKEFQELLKVQDLLSQLLVKNPKKRLGAMVGSTEIKRHQFFNGVNWAFIRSVNPPEVPFDCERRSNKDILLPKLSKKERDEPYRLQTDPFLFF